MLSFTGDPHEQIVETHLWFNDDGPVVGQLDDEGPCWYPHCLTNPELLNELCFPYAFDIKHGFWGVVNHRNEDVRVFKAGKKFNDMLRLDDDVISQVKEFTDLIDDYVFNIDPLKITQELNCDACTQGISEHLLQHIVRHEVDPYILQTLGNMTSQWTSKNVEIMRYALRYLVAQPFLNNNVMFALPPGFLQWTRRLMWMVDEPYSGKLKELAMPHG